MEFFIIIYKVRNKSVMLLLEIVEYGKATSPSPS